MGRNIRLTTSKVTKREIIRSSRKMVMTVAMCRMASVSRSWVMSVKGDDTMATMRPLLFITGAYRA